MWNINSRDIDFLELVHKTKNKQQPLKQQQRTITNMGDEGESK